MVKLKQSFKNRTNRPWFLNLELSTARFGLNPGEDGVLVYEASDVSDDLGAALRIEMIEEDGRSELIVWTRASEIFTSYGRSMEQDVART